MSKSKILIIFDQVSEYFRFFLKISHKFCVLFDLKSFNFYYNQFAKMLAICAITAPQRWNT